MAVATAAETEAIVEIAAVTVAEIVMTEAIAASPLPPPLRLLRLQKHPASSVAPASI